MDRDTKTIVQESYMRDVQTITAPSGKVTRNYSIKPITREIISKHAHVFYSAMLSLPL